MEFSIEERKKEVARLYLQRYTQDAIAEQVGVSQAQVCRDIQSILAEYRRERTEHIDREVAELDEMERTCAERFGETQEREWVAERRAIKERRAKLLGLDAPTKIAPTNPEGDGPPKIKLRWEDDRDVRDYPADAPSGAT